MASLTLGLNAAGHRAVLHAPPENEGWLTDLGCPFRAMGALVRGNPILKAGRLRALRLFVRQEIGAQARHLREAAQGSDLLLATGLAFGARPAAESLGIAYRFVSFAPATSLGTTKDGPGFRFLGWLASQVANAALRNAVNRTRSELGLRPVDDVLASWVGTAPIAATDAALTTVPAGATLRAVLTGYMHLGEPGPLSREVEDFLDAGHPPVYVGFGSMPVPRPDRMGALLQEVARATGRRLIVASGWGRVEASTRQAECLFVGDVPHARLFPRVAAVVHHGGSGTVASAARTGAPQIVFPFMADQFQWRSQVTKLGLGPNGGLLRMLSARSLSKAILECLGSERYKRNAEAVAAAICGKDGVALTVRAVEAVKM